MESKRKTYRAGLDGGKRGRLTVASKDPNFVYRIVNDKDDGARVAEMQEKGYEIVTHSTKIGDKRVGLPTKEGTPTQINVGGGMKAVLMRIKKEWYDEDRAAKDMEIDELEAGYKGTMADAYGKVSIDQKG